MPHEIAQHWNRVKSKLQNGGIFRTRDSDFLAWNLPKEAEDVSVKGIYHQLIRQQSLGSSIFPQIFWKDGFPSKMILFAWLAFHNRNLTWENLMKRGWHGPNVCSLCRSDEDSNFHIFLKCKKTYQIWQELERVFGFILGAQDSIHEWILRCSGQNIQWRRICIISLWFIWKWRNHCIFNSSRISYAKIMDSISVYLESLPQKIIKHKKNLPTLTISEQSSQPSAFFDGAAQKGQCGCGFYIKINESTHFSSFWHGGHGSNNMAEAIALTGLLKFCIFLDIQQVAIFGDSKILVDSVNRRNHIVAPHLTGWRHRINYYRDRMVGSTIEHISRVKNSTADTLSKMGLLSSPGLWFLEIFSEGVTFQIQDFALPDF